MSFDGMGITKMLESKTPSNTRGKRDEDTAEVRGIISPVPASAFAAYPGIVFTISLLSRPRYQF